MSFSPNRSNDGSAVARSRRLAMQYERNLLSFAEYCDNVTFEIITVPDESVEDCVGLVPAAILERYADFLRTTLEPVDFMPCPKPLLVGNASEEEIERKKRELRPKYIRLLMLVKERLREIEGRR